MSCLSFNKLFPARKTWKMLRLKIQSKLHKSKVIHKSPKSGRKKKSKKKKYFSWSILQRRKFKPNKPSSKTLPTLHKCQKRAAPVYIDQLFIQPVVPTAVKAHCVSTVSSFMVQPLLLANKESNKEEMPCSSSTSTRSCAKQLVDDDNNIMRVGENMNIHSVDEMWESLEMSPQMIGINERAEEFIASFRAEMQLQEIIARRL